jgi:hypothetical protein
MTSKAHGCAHTDRPVDGKCISCGKGYCFECGISEKISGRITSEGHASAWGAGGGVTASSSTSEYNYANFCGPCYLQHISRPDYRIFYKVAPNGKVLTLDSTKTPGFNFTEICLGILFAPLCCIGPLVSYWQRGERVTPYKAFLERKAKAERIVQEMGNQPQQQKAAQPVQTDESQKIVFCRKCGQKNEDNKFCSQCGEEMK